ncbi:unnamed protein product [Linum tenue]|uniref:Uncharacterized protein n=1 Tax=Linum tenue TaxID=586396 RepID=A0AAV0QFL0_9ROSI|nr:unnamed protein product [Linum tenue]
MGQVRRQLEALRLQTSQEQALPFLHPHRRQEPGRRRLHLDSGRRRFPPFHQCRQGPDQGPCRRLHVIHNDRRCRGGEDDSTMGGHGPNSRPKRPAHGHLRFRHVCRQFPLLHSQEHHFQGTSSVFSSVFAPPNENKTTQLNWFGGVCRIRRRFQRREPPESRRWRSGYRQIRRRFWGADSWERRTLCMIIWGGTTTKIATLRGPWISYSETACHCSRWVNLDPAKIAL